MFLNPSTNLEQYCISIEVPAMQLVWQELMYASCDADNWNGSSHSEARVGYH